MVATICLFMRFNPRPGEGATLAAPVQASLAVVSIHAPVKGRPIEPRTLTLVSKVSIHAPVKGRHVRVNGQSHNDLFQSTPR